MISKQFLVTGMFIGIIAVFMSMLFRLQLAWPDKSFTIIRNLLGPHQNGWDNES
jgi:cytochrome c oxidase subunit 1